MADIFHMDDEGELSRQLDMRLVVGEINYRLLDDEATETENMEIPAEEEDEVEADSSEAEELQSTFHHGRTANYGGGRGSISKSYEVSINQPFVSSLNDNAQITDRAGDRGLKGPKLSDFEPLTVLGKGAYGTVLLVREKATGRLFAQKQLKKASLIINETKEIHETNYKRTLNEKAILETVSHPNVVKLFFAFQDNNKLYLILEYLDGGELFHHLAQERYLPEPKAAYYIAQIILALRYLHSLGVIYRDLKPENCMLNSSGNLVLTDFGLSKVSSGDDKSHSMIGTAQYMAPEILRNVPYGFAVDWWSLGCVAYDLLTGSPPFTGNNNKKVMDKVLAARKNLKFPYYLSNDAKDFLRKLLQPNPAKRWNVDENFESVKKHRFFRHIDWYQLENIDQHPDALPPILPVITDPALAENFDPEFTNLPFTPASHNLNISYLLPAEGPLFHVKGFTFTNESFLL